LCTDARFQAHVAPTEHCERPERLAAIERALDERGLRGRCVPVAARPATRVELERALLSQSSRVASRLFAEGIAARGVTVKLKYSDFTIKTRAQALKDAIVGTSSIYEVARAQLDRFDLSRRVRLTGVAATRLVPIEETRSLFPDEKKVKDQKLEAVSAALRERFGGDQITRAALLDGGSRRR